MPVTVLPRPASIEPAQVKIDVLTTKTVMKWVKTEKPGAYLYTINESSYINMAQWLLDVQRYIAEQNTLLNYYEDALQTNKKNTNQPRDNPDVITRTQNTDKNGQTGITERLRRLHLFPRF